MIFTIPLITDRTSLAHQVQQCIGQGLHGPDMANVVSIDNYDAAIDYMNMEMPDLACIDFSSTDFNPYALLDIIMGDPWLLHAGIIAFCTGRTEEQRLNEMKFANIIDVIRLDELNDTLPRIMTIINQNRRILFQRVIGLDIKQNISATFQLENDLHAASCYANLVSNFLYNTGKVDRDGKGTIALTMYELLANAIEHGNCGITYDEKTGVMERGEDIQEFIRKRCDDPSIAARRVEFEYTIASTSSKFRIADQGSGFDWKAVPDPTSQANAVIPHGRGILMARAFCKNLTFNERGNEVVFEVEHSTEGGGITPGIFRDIEPAQLAPGDVVLREGEPSDFLYYIVHGSYDVLVGDSVITSLSEEDIFLGEMSFLLDHKRTATVRARTPGRLIKVSKREFVEAIKKKPHYALLLARLLARRISRFNSTQNKK